MGANDHHTMPCLLQQEPEVRFEWLPTAVSLPKVLFAFFIYNIPARGNEKSTFLIP